MGCGWLEMVEGEGWDGVGISVEQACDSQLWAES